MIIKRARVRPCLEARLSPRVFANTFYERSYNFEAAVTTSSLRREFLRVARKKGRKGVRDTRLANRVARSGNAANECARAPTPIILPPASTWSARSRDARPILFSTSRAGLRTGEFDARASISRVCRSDAATRRATRRYIVCFFNFPARGRSR